ncbi:MAG: glycosyl transferase family 2 [Fibrobacteres bacterium]|nr:glycosyl transferase family 2 [Fibrobacterota bacterium]
MYIFPLARTGRSAHGPGGRLILFVVFLTLVYCGLMSFFILGALRLERPDRVSADRNSSRAGEYASVREPVMADANASGPLAATGHPSRPESYRSGAALDGPGSGPSGLSGSGSASGSGPGTPPLPRVSVIVPLRNEEAHAPATLHALSEQDYPGEWEIICVNDRSTDGTEAIIRAVCARDPRFSLVNIPADAPKIPSPKKRALAAGFAAAKGEILMTTDADCMALPGWLRSMASRFKPDTGIVQGPKRIRGEGRLLSRYQEHEVFGLVSIEAATFALGRPMIASAPSLAYRKSLYESVGGFQGLEDTVSGDDDMLVRKMQKVPGWKVAYNPSPDACVTTSPAGTWGTMLTQRARWASNGAHYEEKGFVALLASIYAFYWWLALGPILAAAGLVPWSLYAATVAAKLICNGIFLGITSRRLGHRGILRDLVWCEILHVPIVLAAVIMGHLGLYRWK